MNTRFRSLVQVLRWTLALALLGLALFPAAAAQVSGTLSSTTATLGEDVTYELQIEGGSPDRMPDFPKIDGVRVDFGGRNASYSFVNGKTSQSIQYRFRLTPKKEGSFEVPAIEVTVDGQKYTTQAVTLKVTPQNQATVKNELAYGEINGARQTVYVGESVPIDIRYYLDLSARWGTGGASMPAVEGEGFSSQGMIQLEQGDVEIGGKRYYRFPFRAVISPNRAGKITVGPVNFQLGVSRNTSARNDPFPSIFERYQPYTVAAPALALEVKPLPSEGRPKDFSGAIGDFHFGGQGSPNHVKSGEPVTMTFTVEGTGNFDRVGAPALADPTGWRTYKPTEKFDKADRLGTAGRKTFEVIVVPETKKTAMPVFNFSYFDPEKAKYITLSNTPAPLEVEGIVAPPAGPDAAPTETKPKAAVEDILGIQAAPGFWGVGWQPRPTVWFALLLAPAPLIAFALFWRARRTDPRLAIRAALLRERSGLLGRVRAAEDRAEVFDAAARVLQIDVAVVTGQPDAGIDEATILARCDSSAVKKMYAARAELVYAGHRGGRITANERDEILDAIAEFERSSR